MSEPATTEEVFPEGWCLTSESWYFHRQFFVRVGRPCAHGEYTAMISQIRRHTAPQLARYHYRVTLLDGSALIVSGNWHRLTTAEPNGWTPPAAKAVASASPTPKPPARAPPTTIANPPPRQPLRASTLTLGSPAAARALAERLRRAGIPDHAVGRTSS